MVKILVAPDKFKGSLTAQEVCRAVTEALSKTNRYDVSSLPLADGGEGTFEILLEHFNGRKEEVIVHDPLMRKMLTRYGLSGDGKTAFIEMAKASGLQLLKTEEQNPLLTTTFGTGELIVDALEKKVDTIILAVGGSATNDAGTGMAKALGFDFYTNHGRNIEHLSGGTLENIFRIDISQCDPRLKNVNVITLCDVTNPLTGKNGAAHVFAPQKGATTADVERLENNMIAFENLLKTQFGFNADFEGGGAAGGLGVGAAFFLNAQLKKGMDYVSEVTSLESRIAAADIIITGEGKLDTQSLAGKVVQRVAALAKKHNKKVIALCGVLELSTAQLHSVGVDEWLVLSHGTDKQDAIKNASAILKARLQESVLLRSLK